MAKRQLVRKGTFGSRKLRRTYTSAKTKKAFVPNRYVHSDAKYHNVNDTNYYCDTDGTVTHLDVIPKGDKNSERNGKVFKVTSFQVTGSIYGQANAQFNRARLIYVWDYSPNKTLATQLEIMNDINSYALPNRDNTQRFKILRDLSFSMSGSPFTTGSAVQTSASQYDVSEYIHLPSDAVACVTDTGTLGTISTRLNGALLLLSVGNNVSGAGNAAVTFTGRHRVNFTENI